MRPRLLDLFCGAGGAAMGYHRAGFDVVGVDVVPQPRYPFEFVRDDAMAVLRDVVYYGGTWDGTYGRFDAVHASPPCKGETVLRAVWQDRQYERLLVPTLALLADLGRPWVVENVDNADAPRRSYKVRYCGSALGLRVRRHRWFWSNVGLLGLPCRHRAAGPVVGVTGHGAQGHEYRRGTPVATQTDRRAAMGIDWMNRDELSQAIPPAYTEHIGAQLLEHLNLVTAEGAPS